MKCNIIINLSPLWGDCVICGKETLLGHSVPMYEGEIVDPDNTDDWAGQTVCKKCHDFIYKGLKQ